MPKRVKYEGKIHVFPDGVSDDEIRQALESSSASAPASAPQSGKLQVNGDQPGPMRRFVENAEDAILGTHTNEGVIEGFTKGLPYMAKHPIDSAKLLGSAALKSHEDAASIALKQMHQPGVLPKAIGAARYLTSGIPVIGPSLVQAGEQMENGDIAGGFGTTVGAGAMIAAPKFSESGARLATKVKTAAGEGLKNSSYGIYNNVLGTKGSGLAYEGNPGRGVAQEGLVAGSRPRLLEKIDESIKSRSPQIDQVLDLPQHRAIPVDISEPVTKPFKTAIRSGTSGAASDATLGRLSQAQRELTQERSAPGEYTGQTKNLSGLNPLEANNMKRQIQGRANYANPENDEVVNSTLKQSARGVRDAVHEAVPDVIPFDKRVQDLSGARQTLANRINRRLSNPGGSGFKDVMPGAIGSVLGGAPGAVIGMGGRELVDQPLFKTLGAKGLYKLGNFLNPDAELRIPSPRQPVATPIRGLLRSAPTQLGSSMEPIDATTTSPGPIDWGTRATRTGRLLPEHASMPRPIQMGSHMEPIEDVGPMSQPAASEEQVNPGGPGAYRRNMFTTSSKPPRGIRLPESPYGFGPDEEESEIERARRR